LLAFSRCTLPHLLPLREAESNGIFFALLKTTPNLVTPDCYHSFPPSMTLKRLALTYVYFLLSALVLDGPLLRNLRFVRPLLASQSSSRPSRISPPYLAPPNSNSYITRGVGHQVMSLLFYNISLSIYSSLFMSVVSRPVRLRAPFYSHLSSLLPLITHVCGLLPFLPFLFLVSLFYWNGMRGSSSPRKN